MGARWTRRAVLLSPVASRLLADRGHVFAPERVRFADGATELEVNRLTAPEHSSFLPPPHCRAASSKGGFLIFASDRGGTLQALRMDVRSGESRVLTEAASLVADSINLLSDEKSIVYFDGDKLMAVQIGNQRERELYRCDSGASFAKGLTVSDDGLQAAFVLRDKGNAVLMFSSILKGGGAQRVIDVPANAGLPLLRPKRAAVLYQMPDGLWLVGLDGQDNRKLKTPPGEIRAPQWAPDGRTLLYLLGTELREHTPDTNTDTPVARTSQFATFGRNADASVFVGASQSLAGPYVLLLLRVTRREFALCEHRCSNPSQVNPIFSPSSQRIYFQSDRSGKMAIYTMAVERLVEKTET